jgi:hypothetical protein
MENFKKALAKIYDIFMSNWKQFLIVGLIYLLIFFAFKNIFDPLSEKFSKGFEMIDNSKMNNTLIKSIITGIVSLSMIASLLVCINNFFTGVFINIFNNPELNYILALKKTLKSFWKILGFSIIEFFIVVFGLIFFLIPGIYMLFIFFFAFPTMINENLSILKAIKKAKKSFRQNMGKKIKIILLLKFFLFIAAIIFSMAEIDGIGTLADLFMSSTLAYLLIYTPEEILPITEKLTTENE